ncbi:hypothetical protein [Nocardia wallacei]|uniref:hypothetical protein n=1 Tax=Nocardia wallacei TaxID=480035 RepID=UPI0024577B2A|nr:hypothetical protein [Nocardia wallacei]
MIRRNRNVKAVIRVGLAALPVAVALACAGAPAAVAGPVQPGVTTPKQPTEPSTDEPADFRSAAPQNTAPAPQAKPRPEKKPDQPPASEPPAPRSVRIGEFSAPVPDAVPSELVDGVNRTTEGIQNALTPGTPPPAK